MPSDGRAYKDPEYLRNRATLLAGDPVCAIGLAGCLGRATTVDHILEVARGGDHSLANLRPACRPCNEKLGGRFGNARSRANGHHAGERPPGPRQRVTRPVDPLELIPTKGRFTPRLETPKMGDGSYGPAVTKWAKRNMPNPVMRWQSHAFNRMLATAGGRLVHRQALESVARQNGKTTGLEALVGYWCTEHADRHGRQTVAWLSHDLKLTEAVVVRLSRILEARIVAKTFSFGRQRLEFDNGSVLIAQSNTVNAGHGWSFDMVIADESWRIKPEAINDGIIPAMRARPNPLLIMASTAGDEGSTLLRQWRERGLNTIEAGGDAGSFCFLEWSIPPAADWHDPRWWAWPNPCLGTTLTPETLLAEYDGPDRSAFLRASLNMWTSSSESWLQPGVWDRCVSFTAPDPLGGSVAAEVAMAGDRFYALRAWYSHGVTYVRPLIITEHEDELWQALDGEYATVDTVAITPTLEAHLPPTMARKATVVGLRELARNVPLLRSMITSGQVVHLPSTLLDEHVGRAVATKQAGLSTAHSSGSIELARCLVWAVALASRPTGDRRPAIGYAKTA